MGAGEGGNMQLGFHRGTIARANQKISWMISKNKSQPPFRLIKLIGSNKRASFDHLMQALEAQDLGFYAFISPLPERCATERKYLQPSLALSYKLTLSRFCTFLSDRVKGLSKDSDKPEKVKLRRGPEDYKKELVYFELHKTFSAQCNLPFASVISLLCRK